MVPEPMTHARAFLNGAIVPVLHAMGMSGVAAEKLLLMTAAHESMGFRYRRQVGGPALSYFQIEPATLDDLYANYLAFRPRRQTAVDAFLPAGMDRLEALEHDDRYACALARMIYARVAEALPDAEDELALANYAKRYWNTPSGKATAEKYLRDFRAYGPTPAPVHWTHT
jgi:hypothetical protein